MLLKFMVMICYSEKVLDVERGLRWWTNGRIYNGALAALSSSNNQLDPMAGRTVHLYLILIGSRWLWLAKSNYLCNLLVRTAQVFRTYIIHWTDLLNDRLTSI